jgi:hypothetical protein
VGTVPWRVRRKTVANGGKASKTDSKTRALHVVNRSRIQNIIMKKRKMMILKEKEG